MPKEIEAKDRPNLIRSDLDNTREDDRYGDAPAAPGEAGSGRFPEVTPDGQHSVRGGFDRFAGLCVQI